MRARRAKDILWQYVREDGPGGSRLSQRTRDELTAIGKRVAAAARRLTVPVPVPVPVLARGQRRDVNGKPLRVGDLVRVRRARAFSVRVPVPCHCTAATGSVLRPALPFLAGPRVLSGVPGTPCVQVIGGGNDRGQGVESYIASFGPGAKVQLKNFYEIANARLLKKV